MLKHSFRSINTLSRIVKYSSLPTIRYAPLSHFQYKEKAIPLKNSNIWHVSKCNFSNVWGERTIQWIDEQITAHMNDHEGDYDFDKVPYMEDTKSVGYQRKAIVTPCVQQATSSYLIDELLKQNYCIRGIAVPESSEEFIESRFRMKNANIKQEKDTFEGKEIDVKIIEDGDLNIEQRIIESFKLNANEIQTFDVIFDEMPLLKYDENIKNAKIQTTVLGHGLKTGGLLYLQCEGAKDRKEKIALIRSIQSYYPETHFDLIESRRTPWTRQFIFLKVDNTV
eukprot:196254_1